MGSKLVPFLWPIQEPRDSRLRNPQLLAGSNLQKNHRKQARDRRQRGKTCQRSHPWFSLRLVSPVMSQQPLSLPQLGEGFLFVTLTTQKPRAMQQIGGEPPHLILNSPFLVHPCAASLDTGEHRTQGQKDRGPCRCSPDPQVSASPSGLDCWDVI